MFNRHVVLIALIGLCMGAGAAQAGGWATVSLNKKPRQVIAGQAFDVAFTVRQNGVTPRSGLEPTVTAVCGKRQLKIAATPLPAVGQYAASVTLPGPGEWLISVDSRFCATQMSPVKLRAVAAVAKPS